MIKYSIIIPVFNEQDAVILLCNSLIKVMERLDNKYEIIFINDGSTDNTSMQLEKMEADNPLLSVINFHKNMGQGKALEEGFRYAKGEIIITMDGDLQNDPEDIPLLISKIEAGFDLVCGWRHPRKDSLIKTVKSQLGNFLQKKITKLNLHDISCTVRAYRKEIVKDIVFRNKHDFTLLPYLISKKHKIKIAEIAIRHHKRKLNKPKYGLLTSAYEAIYSYLKLILNSNKK